MQRKRLGGIKGALGPGGSGVGNGRARLKNAFSLLEPTCGVLCAHLDKASVI